MHSPRISLLKRNLPAIIASFFGGSFTSPGALTLPPGFAEQLIGTAWVDPVGVAIDPAPAAANRLYVWERAGRVWLVENGVKLATPLIDLREEVANWGDFGMLGFALHPNFQQNGYLYLYYVVDRHHLLNAGTPGYDPAANLDFAATIGRITRYTARASDGFHSVDPASRTVLLGESKTTGIPILHTSHGVGQLVFGNDGTLLASCGEAANFYDVDNGTNPAASYAPQALIDGIIQPKENVGSYRSQLVDSLSGKILRLDPATGDGLASNPFFDAAHPRAPRSRVWALGFRNPYRFTVHPETGSFDPALGQPGVILLGDVGWGAWEELDVIDGPGKNCGWPLFEGLTSHDSLSFTRRKISTRPIRSAAISSSAISSCRKRSPLPRGRIRSIPRSKSPRASRASCTRGPRSTPRISMSRAPRFSMARRRAKSWSAIPPRPSRARNTARTRARAAWFTPRRIFPRTTTTCISTPITAAAGSRRSRSARTIAPSR